MKVNFTEQKVKNYWDYISRVYGMKIVQKRNSHLMKFISWFLNLFNIVPKDFFMNSFTTTIGKTVYVPFELGNGLGDNQTLESQFSTLVHENQHVIQYMREGIKFFVKYLFSSSCRARYEAEAYTSNLELYYFMYGSIFDVYKVAKSLQYYNCSYKDIGEAVDILNTNVILIQNGKSICESSNVAIMWLEEQI